MRRASCFDGRVLVFPSRGGRVERDGCRTRGVSFEVGTPLPRAGEARRPLAVTAPLRLRDAERLRSRGRWQELRRGEPLGLGDTKQPDGPAGLHGGCTESGLIRGTRPSSKLTTGPGFPALAARTRPAWAQRVLAAAARSHTAPGEPGRARGARGADSGLPRPASSPGSSTSCPSGAAQRAGVGRGWSSVLPSPSPAAPGKLLKASRAPKRWELGWDGGSGRGVCACACRRCAPAQPAPHPGS